MSQLLNFTLNLDVFSEYKRQLLSLLKLHFLYIKKQYLCLFSINECEHLCSRFNFIRRNVKVTTGTNFKNLIAIDLHDIQSNIYLAYAFSTILIKFHFLVFGPMKMTIFFWTK